MGPAFNLKPEDEFLLKCSVSYMGDADVDITRQMVKSDLDWDYLTKMAYRHRLSSLLYWQLNNICPEEVPSEIMRKLREHFENNVKKNLMMFRELLNVIQILHKNGINPIPYKGPVLAIMTYNNLGLREFVDLDFYVTKEEVLKTQEILIENGYEPLMELTDNQKRVFFKFQREYHFMNESTHITLEIKWKFLSTMFPIQNELFTSYPNAFKEVNLDQYKVKTIQPELLIMILCTHNASHSFSDLYRFCDLSELIKSQNNVNWQELIKIAEQLEMKRIFLVNLCLLREMFQIDIPKAVLDLISKDKMIFEISEKIINRLFSDKKSLGNMGILTLQTALREKMITKIRTVLHLIFTPTPEVIESVSLPRTLEPLYYFLKVNQMLKNIITNK